MSEPKSSRQRYLAFRQRAPRAADEEGSSAPRNPRGALAPYLRWLKPYLRPALVVVMLAALAAATDMLHPLFMRYLVDDVLLAPTRSTASKLMALHLTALTYLAVLVLGQSADAARMYLLRSLTIRQTLTLRRALQQHLLHLPLARLAQLKAGGVVSRLSTDVDHTAGLLQMGFISPTVSMLRLALAIVILFVLNWKLALAAVAVIPAIVFASLLMARRVRPIYRDIREDASRIDGRVAEAFAGIRAVRAFGREHAERRAFGVAHHTIARKELHAHRLEILLWSAWGFFLALVSLAILWLGGLLQLRGAATIGDIMSFQWYVLLMLNPVWRIVESFSELQRALASADRVFAALAWPLDKPDRAEALPAPTDIRELRLENVTFSYADRPPAVSDVSLVIPGGATVALVGRSGAGKTTLTDLVARFHDPDSGRVLLNGYDLRDLTLRSYRQLLGIVGQEVLLFDGSVAEAIAYGKHNASAAEIRGAAEKASAHQFIAALPAGYDTLIGERGVRLSGGERQRLAIARAFLADPRILILDEATSSLDAENEQLIQASLRELLAGRTTLIIAHRFSTIRHADWIVVMDQAQLVEQGTHDELLAANGRYASLLRNQILTTTP